MSTSTPSDKGPRTLNDIFSDLSESMKLPPAIVSGPRSHAHVDEDDRVCPDGGTCHHDCSAVDCFRVRCCGPLTGVYPGDRWPTRVRVALGGRGAAC